MHTITQSKPPFALSSVLVKLVMATSGLGMAVWLTLHMLGNLSWLAGPGAMNGYADKLRATGLLWPERALLISAFLVHVVCAILTTRRAHAARPIAYKMRGRRKGAAAIASRSIRWTGVILLGFVVYHIASMYGVAHPAFVAGDVHHNLRALMQHPVHGLALIAATALIALHLGHGLASAWITLGLVSRRRERLLRRALLGWTCVITVGFSAPVIACWLGA